MGTLSDNSQLCWGTPTNAQCSLTINTTHRQRGCVDGMKARQQGGVEQDRAVPVGLKIPATTNLFTQTQVLLLGARHGGGWQGG